MKLSRRKIYIPKGIVPLGYGEKYMNIIKMGPLMYSHFLQLSVEKRKRRRIYFKEKMKGTEEN